MAKYQDTEEYQQELDDFFERFWLMPEPAAPFWTRTTHREHVRATVLFLFLISTGLLLALGSLLLSAIELAQRS